MIRLFRDRRDAGRQLGAAIARQFLRDPVVLGLPRGGIPVAYEVALALHAPLDVFVVRKLGVPGHEELAMGAIASGGVRVLVPDVVRDVGITDETLESVTAAERVELDRRERAYRGGRAFPQLAGATVLLVDDGAATGASMIAAVRAVRALHPSRVIAALPVLSTHARTEILKYADACEAIAVQERFHSVGGWYADFGQTTDDEVRELLRAAVERQTVQHPTPREINGISKHR